MADILDLDIWVGKDTIWKYRYEFCINLIIQCIIGIPTTFINARVLTNMKYKSVRVSTTFRELFITQLGLKSYLIFFQYKVGR